MKRGMVVTIAALVLAGCGLACAQQYAQSPPVDIDFSFMAGKETFPAGKYIVEIKESAVIVLRGGGKVVIMPVITRLGRHDKDTDFEFVFDKVADRLLLSEVWFPGIDGYLVLITKQAHEHAVVGGSNPKK